jgi:hypothetical protein
MAVSDYIAELGPICRDEKRRADILSHPYLNGIESVEFTYPYVLVVRFLKPLLPDPPYSDSDGAYGLTTSHELVRIHGGTRFVNIHVLNVEKINDHLKITVDQNGDFSVYWLTLGWEKEPDGRWTKKKIKAIDHQYSRAPFSFKAGCPVDIDCRIAQICPPDRPVEPALDYKAKDYSSFRQLLIDLIPQLNPSWLERNPSDLGIALAELLAYTGDYLSYFQDAVANEAYLDTARQRVSAKRHARLIDYSMHDGRNAWTYVHFAVDTKGTIPQHTKVLSRIAAPLRNQAALPGVVIQEAYLPDDAFETDPALRRVTVFETTFPVEVNPESNKIYLHTWGNLECCLPRGTTSVYLYSVDGTEKAVPLTLKRGDLLLIEEIKGPITGKEADADPAHRQVVQIVDTREDFDRAYKDELQNGLLQVCDNDKDNPLPLLQVFWDRVDALTFPLCLSSRPQGKYPLHNISVARGNIVLADNGHTVHEEIELTEPVSEDEPFLISLSKGPLTVQLQPNKVDYSLDIQTGGKVVLDTARLNLKGDVRHAMPAIALRVDFPADREVWKPVPHLLDSSPFDLHFVADLDHQGRATLRFGDGEYGRKPSGANTFGATYRVGNGRSGNVGAEAMVHLVKPDRAAQWPKAVALRNPLPARDGTDPETIEEVRQYAPAASHAEQFRAVTEADYTAAARKMPDIADAVAMFRWTGSWYTVYLGIDPWNPEDLITEPGGRTRLDPDFEERVRAFITRYRLAGYDLEIRAGKYVPLDIDLKLCVVADFFCGDVGEAVRHALSNRINPDGARGFFHPDNFTFGQAVYLSKLYAAVEAVEGVDSVVVTRFQRYGQLDNGELDAGFVPMGSWEIARLDNDPNFLENGVLRITTGGGK